MPFERLLADEICVYGVGYARVGMMGALGWTGREGI